jgi:regulator of protease activity HflC (stomatin/prohibitin superfamily)
MKTEKTLTPFNGYLSIACAVIAFACMIIFAVYQQQAGIAVSLVLFIFITKGLVIVAPNDSKVLLLFGNYVGSIYESGIFWINPLYKRTNLSRRARNFESDLTKVNDKMGNPVIISVILVWRVKDTFKASFEVNNFEQFVKIQTDSAVRKLAGSFPYDHFEDERAAVTLSTNFDDINLALESELTERMQLAGIEVVEARIGHLSYAPEIAHSMLRRQQASAVVAARHKIVEGAVGMVESALRLLSEKEIINLDEDKKAAMVSNLMVVLCGDRETQPIVNTGTLYQ